MSGGHQVDEPGPVRGGEELDARRIDEALRGLGLGLPAGLPTVRQFPGGASNLTYLLRWEKDGRERELILRRPPFGDKAKSAHDMKREAGILEALAPLYPHVPRVVATVSDSEILGCDFYLMERLRGIILRRDLPPGLALDAAAARKLCLAVVDKLIELHSIEDLSTLVALGRGEGYVRRQIEGWSDRYRRARTDDAAGFETVMAWLAEKQPERDAATRLLHNDFRFDNVVLAEDDPLRVVGVLDWEMATLGDPLADLGNTLAYWTQADDDPAFQRLRRQPTHLPGMLTRDEVLAYYGERTGLCSERFDFYLVYGTFRLAAIAQQIYYRYHHGQTRNPAFAAFGPMTHVLERRALGILERSTL
jgi:aminoglycoside phosphotransferase (APT) family kinase protein